jgi:hypothetical protein
MGRWNRCPITGWKIYPYHRAGLSPSTATFSLEEEVRKTSCSRGKRLLIGIFVCTVSIPLPPVKLTTCTAIFSLADEAGVEVSLGGGIDR